MMIYRSYAVAAAAVVGVVDAAAVRRQDSASSAIPDYLQTSPEIYPGPTPTGIPAFLAETNPAPFPSTTYIPPQPLETQTPIQGNTDGGNIFELMGQLSPYFSNPEGWGVHEYPLPADASIVQLNMLSRHGARYPTSGSEAPQLADKIANYTNGTLGDVTFSGQLAFLNGWENKLGAEILVPVGKEQLFESGTLHQYLYGHLYPNDGSKIIARSTHQDRMTQSAEYFLAGFFGLDWPTNATLVLAIEGLSYGPSWNTSLGGDNGCPNSQTYVNHGGRNATAEWIAIYLADATERLSAQAPGFNWTAEDSFAAQSTCAYETVALGYSSFCDLFTYEEWEGYEYAIDLSFAGGNMFQSPVGRAIGIGYQQEILARLQHHLVTEPAGTLNVTLDSNPDTFPLNQTLNFDFSHDTNIVSILTAFGLTQFNQYLPPTEIARNRTLYASRLTPFAARLDMEIIESPAPLSHYRNADGGCDHQHPGGGGGTTRYIHFLLNQRTIPLGASFPECGDRQDGWCELTTFFNVQASKLQESQFDYACFGDYPAVPYGTITNGVPQDSSPMMA